MKQTVTICIPTYNKALYLKESISSIINQTFKEFKLLVVDDASSDNTEDIVKSFTDQRIHYIRNESRLGLGANWNKCLELGLEQTGEMLAIYHDDDIYSNTILERQVKFLDSNPETGLVHTALYYKNDKTGKKTLKKPYPNDRTNKLMDLLNDLCKHRNYHITTPSVLARKDAYRKAGNFDLSFKICPDLDLWWRMLEHYDLGYISDPLITVRIHSHQVSASDPALKNMITQNETLEVLRRVINRLKTKDSRFNDTFFHSKVKCYCATEVLRGTVKALSASNRELFHLGTKRAIELSPTPNIFMIISILKLLNNAIGRGILSKLTAIHKIFRAREAQ